MKNTDWNVLPYLLWGIFGGLLFVGCGPEPVPRETRKPITLESIAVVVRDAPRSFMLSDKRGGFLVGTAGRGGTQPEELWTVGGREILRHIVIGEGGHTLDAGNADSCIVYPHQIVRCYPGGTQVSLTLLECGPRRQGLHVLGVKVERRTRSDIGVLVPPAPEFSRAEHPSHGKSAYWESPLSGRVLELSAGDAGEVVENGVVVRNVEEATFLLLYFSPRSTDPHDIYRHADSLWRARAVRIEHLLNDSYLRTSDENLNKALNWVKVSLDALVIEAGDTIAVAGLPWDGSIEGRENAQSIAGIGLATGDYGKTAGILRTLARWQDTIPAHRTYGRIADCVRHGIPSFGAADVGPWFVREMYEHVVYANDTALARSMFPVVERSIRGTRKYHTDASNLLIHGDHETWMGAVPRGNRAAEVQLLWYFQQLIGSFMASYVGEKALGELWSTAADKTSDSFNRLFVDTVRHRLYDHIKADNRGVAETRPNCMMCLEIITSEAVQQNMLRETITHIVYPYGVGTLDSRDARFRAEAPGTEQGSTDPAEFNGPVWTWLAGQFVYSLTRYDRQDFSYSLTDRMVRQVVEGDMVGSLPEMFDVPLREDDGQPLAAGRRASLTGMAEFVRSVYQDYLGIRIDGPSRVISFQPKLPDHITDVEFTVYAGSHPIKGMYQRGKEASRFTVQAVGIPLPMKLQFVWMMDDSNAWRGLTELPPNTTVRVIFGPEELIVYQGDQKVVPTGVWHLKGFSRRKEFSGFDFARSERVP